MTTTGAFARRRASAVLGAALALVVVTGCVADPPPPTVVGDERTDGTAVTLTDGGVLLAVDRLEEGFNPHLLGDQGVDTDLVASLVLPSAFVPGPDGDPVLNRDLLRSAGPLPGSPETIRYTIDQQAQWSDGVPVTIPSPVAAHALGIATVFQDLALCDNLDVVSNLYLGRELRRGRGLDEVTMEETARRVLGDLNARVPSVRVPVSTLSGGQRQSVAIARTLLGEPRIVVLDEPTAALSVAQSAEVLTHIQRLRDMGHAVILISHNMTDVRAVADRVEVLRHGRNNGSFSGPGASYEEIIAAITGATTGAGGSRDRVSAGPFGPRG